MTERLPNFSDTLSEIYRSLWHTSTLPLNKFCALYGIDSELLTGHTIPNNKAILFYRLAR